MNYTQELVKQIESLQTPQEKIDLLNEIRKALHEASPMKHNPIDLVLWEKQDSVTANDYNPNQVAPPEMELLEVSIVNDWYTQPIVWWKRDDWVCEIIDWFHRHRVWKESKLVSHWLYWYLPLVNIRKAQQWKNDRIASTIRHNRARGKHKVDAMSEIVIELKNRNWNNERIAKQLGMDDDEVLRLLQVSWLQDMFKDDDFSNAWVSEDSNDVDLIELDDTLTDEYIDWVRVVNVDDPDRIFHTYDKWECHKNWLYATKVDWKSEKECEEQFAKFFTVDWLFESVADKVISEWKYSCEQYLTNKCMNRIAWMWQACVCYHTWIPKKYCWWWFLLSDSDRNKADVVALNAINKWLVNNNKPTITMDRAKWWDDRQMNIY